MKEKNIDKKRWGILIACCAINICLGSIYAWSVLASAMSDYFMAGGKNITPGDLAIVYTIANAVGPITMISGYFGPQVMRNVYTADGAYQRAFLIACALSAVGVVLTFLYRIANKKNK